MRQLCNIAYALRVEAFDKDEHKAFDAELVLDPGDERKASRGTSDLMAMVMGGGARGR